jgi:2-phospho-L-lactate guanylyltransferase
MSLMLDEPARPMDPQHGACALIAIKERVRCKMRLAHALPASARIKLVRSMLAAVLSAAAAARTVRRVIVVSPERDCIPAEIPVLADAGNGLNSALTQAYLLVREFGWREVVVLPADLPNIAAAEIDHLVRAGQSSGFAIAPDATGAGTNALCLVSAHPFGFRFGPDSRRLHLEEAERAGLRSRVVRLPGLAFDVDLPADLEQLDREPWRARLQA